MAINHFNNFSAMSHVEKTKKMPFNSQKRYTEKMQNQRI